LNIFAVFVGTTGPLILFDEALIQVCERQGFDFLTVRLYVGMWLTVIALAVAAFEGSAYVRLFTRFLQEIFSALITLIYLVETALKLVSTFQRHPLLAEYIYAEPITPLVENVVAENAYNEVDGNFTEILTTTLKTTTMAVVEAMSNMTDVPNLLTPSDKNGPLNQPNTALLCMTLTLGTFVSAYSLKIFRNSKFLGRNARRALGEIESITFD
jgi:HCO3- transporter family